MPPLDDRCGQIAGELIVSHARGDAAAERMFERLRERELDGDFDYAGDIDERLERLGLRPVETGRVVRLVRVPERAEQWSIQRLHEAYRYHLFEEWDHRTADPQVVPWMRSFSCAPNQLLTISGTPAAGPADVTLSKDHATYAGLIGFPHDAVTSTRAPKVVILDTGIAPSAGVRPAEECNFVPGATNPSSAADDNGHGTTVASIIHALVPRAQLIVYKVADASGRASEWDTLCALGASYDADVVNMSLVFGLATRRCAVCGVESGSSRSAVFGYFLEELARRSTPPVVVAAAGNKGAPELLYPARFGSVLAVGSVTQDLVLWSHSNYGDDDEGRRPHARRFVLPGGGKGGAGYVEHVATRARDGLEYCGTSFAAAYATAVVAALRSARDAHSWPNRALIAHLKQHARMAPSMTADTTRYGNGLMILVPPPLPSEEVFYI